MSNYKAEYANELHDRNYNCCQSVVCAFAEELGVDMRTVFMAGEGFGHGIGGMDGICGALSGAVIASGFKNSDGNLEEPKTKHETTALSGEMLERFRKKTGALTCRDIKREDIGEPLCSCQDCIKAGVEVIQEVLGL